MQKAVPVGASMMAALLGLDYEAAMAVADEAAQGQDLPGRQRQWRRAGRSSGDKAAIDHASGIARPRSAKRAMLLPVSAPFHCKLMQLAINAMARRVRHHHQAAGLAADVERTGFRDYGPR